MSRGDCPDPTLTVGWRTVLRIRKGDLSFGLFTQTWTWVGSTHGLGWVGLNFDGHIMGWVGLGWHKWVELQ